jgi:hypothetical protein
MMIRRFAFKRANGLSKYCPAHGRAKATIISQDSDRNEIQNANILNRPIARYMSSYMRKSNSLLRSSGKKAMSKEQSKYSSKTSATNPQNKIITHTSELMTDVVSQQKEDLGLFARVKNRMEPIKEIVAFIRMGTKLTFYDFLYWMKFWKNKNCDKVSKVNNFFRVKRINRDFRKFIGFGFFDLMPGAFFFIPMYIAFFPNGLPTHFQHQIYTKLKTQFKEERKIIAKYLLLEKLKNMPDFKKEYASIFPNNIRKTPKNATYIKDEVIKELTNCWKSKFAQSLAFEKLNFEEKCAIFDFLGVDYKSGMHIRKVLLNFRQYYEFGKLALKSRDFSHLKFRPVVSQNKLFHSLKLKLVNRQFEKLLKRVALEDKEVSHLSVGELFKLEADHLNKYLSERGIADPEASINMKQLETYRTLNALPFEQRVWIMLVSSSLKV